MSLLTLAELGSEISRKYFRPIYLVTGDETYFVRQAIKLLKENVIASESFAFNYSEISAREVSASEILHAANTFPMMAQHRLVLVTDVECLEEDGQAVLMSYMQAPALKCVLVLQANELDRRTGFFRAFKDSACVVDCPKIKGAALSRWAEEFVRRKGYRINTMALNRLVELAGSEVQSLAGEIEKLFLYAGRDKTIDGAVVEELVQGSRHHTIFELTKAIGKRDRKAGLMLLGNLLEAGEAPLWILSMLGRQFRQMLTAKEMMAEGRSDRDVAQAAQVPSFLAAEFMGQVRSVERSAIEKIYVRLAEIDHRIKSSGAVERIVLESLICSL